MTYYQSRVQAIEDLRSVLKHSDPDNVNLSDIRGTLGYIIADLQVLDSLRRPDSFTISRISEDGVLKSKVEIIMIVEEEEAEDMVQKLWLRKDGF